MDIVFLSAKMGTNVNRLVPMLVEVRTKEGRESFFFPHFFSLIFVFIFL